MSRLRVTEIFYSIQGESSLVGIPTVFIRLTGCPLRCQYCDTAYAFSGGDWWTIEDIIKRVKQYQTYYVCLTGGEPLAQKDSISLMSQLCDESYRVSLETSGAVDVSEVDPRVVKIMDLKTPGSKECARNRYENIDFLQPHDEIKYVICDRNDYEWAKDNIKEHRLTERHSVFFSPSYEQLDHRVLAEWILQDQLPVRMQIQLHKIIWGDLPGV